MKSNEEVPAVMHTLHDTAWLAKRLNISVTTIERLRVRKSPDVPPHLTIGHSIRYDAAVVEAWLHGRFFAVTDKEFQNEP